MKKLTNPQTDLHGVDAGIQIGQSSIGNVHVTQFEAEVVCGTEHVHAECGLIGEVHGVGIGGNIVIGENSSTAEFEVRRETPVTLEVPFQGKRIKTDTVGSVCGLEDEEDGYGIYGIFEASAKKTGQMGAGKDPSVAQAGVEDPGIAASSCDRMAAASPDLNFVAALLGTGLGREGDCRHCGEQESERGEVQREGLFAEKSFGCFQGLAREAFDAALFCDDSQYKNREKPTNGCHGDCTSGAVTRNAQGAGLPADAGLPDA